MRHGRPDKAAVPMKPAAAASFVAHPTSFPTRQDNTGGVKFIAKFNTLSEQTLFARLTVGLAHESKTQLVA